jgi:hypothetical protein
MNPVVYLFEVSLYFDLDDVEMGMRVRSMLKLIVISYVPVV